MKSIWGLRGISSSCNGGAGFALRELELAGAVLEARADYQARRIADTSIKGHIRRIHYG